MRFSRPKRYALEHNFPVSAGFRLDLGLGFVLGLGLGFVLGLGLLK
jgi:hypothetical protein